MIALFESKYSWPW